MLVLLAALSVIVEWLLYFVNPLWSVRRWYVALPIVLTSFSTGSLLGAGWNVWQIPLVFVVVFRLVNHLRITEGRMHETYLKHTTKRCGIILGATQLVILFGYIYIEADIERIWLYAVFMQIAAAVFVTMITVRNIIKTRHRPSLENFTDRELPTVTVAIPARNETAMLENCLHSIISNDYPKLEILVLDDCSHDRTPEIIKQFAQDGVRFIKGAEPSSHWLAKNRAYDKLADEANGDYILFCGVDARFGPQTIRSLITTALTKNKAMISVLPRRLSSDVLATFIQPMRYWWELALPRRYFNRPSVLSTCWLIDRNELRIMGGFDAVQRTILPEGYFARELVKQDRYSFVRADDLLDVQTRKGLREQRETAIRMRYPQLRRRLELVAGIVAAECILLLGPFITVISTYWVGLGPIQMLGASAALLLVMTHVLIAHVSNPANVIVATVNFPIVVLSELVLGSLSMLKYEFARVEWKGRNICLPVMHVVPHNKFRKDNRL